MHISLMLSKDEIEYHGKTSPSRVCWAGHPCRGMKEPGGEEEREKKELAGSKFSARLQC